MALVIPHHDVEPESARLPGHRASNVAVAHDAEGAPVRLAQRTAAMEVPDAGAHVGIDLIDASQARERKSDGVIAHHLGAVAGHITHGAAVGRGRRDIDVVHPGAGLADHLQRGSAANTSAVKRP